MGQIADAKVRLAQATTEEEQSRMQLGMSEAELKGLESRWKDVEREVGEGKRNLESMQVEVEKFRKKVAQSGWNVEREQQGQKQLNDAKAEVRRLTEVFLSPCDQQTHSSLFIDSGQHETTAVFA